MALSSNSMRGFFRKYSGRAVERLVIHQGDTTPVYSPFHIRPSTTPSGTAAEGDISWNATNNAPEFYDGASWQTVQGTSNYARTATADGTGTGTIPAGADFVTVTSANADHIVVLPEPVIGRRVRLANGATGYELRSSAPATVAINGGTGAGAESAIAASMYVECRCKSATAWICNQYAAAGTESAVEAAA